MVNKRRPPGLAPWHLLYDARMRPTTGFLAALVLAGGVLPVAAADRIYHLSIGDPARRDRDVPVVLDTIVDTATGDTIDPAAMARRLADARLVLVGEAHTSVESHRVELQVIRALTEAGRQVTIALEMFPYPDQPALDAWNDGAWSEDDFVAKSHWYEAWGYHWGYYRAIFDYARRHHIRFVAANAPRDLVTAVRQKGLGSLPADQAEHLPPYIDAESADYLTFFKASFDEDDALHGGMPDAALKGMLAAQSTWDGAMAWNATKAFDPIAADPQAVVVVLVGSGHVAYGLGIERQARAWFHHQVASVVAVPIADDDGPIPSVRASYANFVWGVAYEKNSRWPSLGISTKAGDQGRRQIIDVEKDTPAARAGLAVGDLLVAIDRTPIDGRETLNRVMAGYQWGDVPEVTVHRADEDVTVSVPLRRTP
jgi:uncharacterized iron-regulated protein